MKGELRSLTSARGIAAWLVVLYHVRASTPWMAEPVMALLHKGYLAVDFFFLLSGFVIYLSAHRALLRDGMRAVPEFLVRRFARIYPLYGLMLAGTLAFALVLRIAGKAADGYPLGELPLHVAMLQNWGFTPALSWNHPAWSISTEFAAYLLFPLLILRTPIARASRPNLLGAMIVTIALLTAALTLSGEINLNGNIARFGLIRCLAEFLCGALLCAFWLRGPDSMVRALLLSLGGTALFWGLWIVGAGNEIWTFPAGAACLILALAHASGMARNPLHWRPLLWLGEVSYATYICHYMLFIGFKLLFVSTPAISPVQLFAFIGCTLAASALLHSQVEKPGRQWARHILPRRFSGTKRTATG